MQLYPHLLSFCKEIAPTWRKTQRVNLALLGQALFRRRSLILSELARTYPVPLQRKASSVKHGLLHRVKRLSRFLSNDDLDQAALMMRLTRLSYSVCRTPGLLLPILLDLTYFDPFAVLSAAVPRGGRALPIAWRTFRRNLEGETELSQNRIIQTAVRQMRERIAAGVEPVIVADREFAVAAFFRFLKEQHCHFVIRVDAETWMLHERYTGALGSSGVQRGGRRMWWPGARYGKEEQEPVNLFAVWASEQKEPWFIASDLDDPRLVERLYRKRMKIEHGFRDWKHHLRLKGTLHVRVPARFGGLILGVAVLYWYVCLIGSRLNHPRYRGEVGCWGRLGDFKLGLELLALDHPAITRTAQRLVQWTAGKLIGLSPPTPAYKLRYRCHRWPLRQTG